MSDISNRHRSLSNRQNRQSRLKGFSEDDKKTLVSYVKEADHLWNPKNVEHSNSKAVESTWNEIGLKMGKTKEACKIAWVALRESYRYHTKVSRRVRVYGEDDDPLKHVKSDLDFIQDMTFLDDATNFSVARKVRRLNPYAKISACDPTTEQIDDPNNSSTDNYVDDSPSENFLVKSESTTYLEFNDSTQMEFDANDPDDNDENYHSSLLNNDALSIQTKSNPTVPKKPINSSQSSQENAVTIERATETRPSSVTVNLIKQVGHLVKAQTEFIQYLRGNGATNLAFHTQLSACDALLQQLPKNKAEATLMEMQTYILKKLNDHHRRQIENGT